jgi:hypothetical protein
MASSSSFFAIFSNQGCAGGEAGHLRSQIGMGGHVQDWLDRLDRHYPGNRATTAGHNDLPFLGQEIIQFSEGTTHFPNG